MPEHTCSSDCTAAVALRRIVDDDSLHRSLRTDADRALHRLDSGAWTPQRILAHNDLWTGNVLLDGSGVTVLGAVARRRMVVIDWAGARFDGFGFFDLIRLASSLRLPRSLLHRELSAHCRILACDPLDARSTILAALGLLGLRLEHFAPERFAAMAHHCMETMAAFTQDKGETIP